MFQHQRCNNFNTEEDHNNQPRELSIKETTILPPEFTIRKATIDDIDELQEVGRITFYEAFKGTCSDDDMQAYLDTSFSTQQLTIEITNPHSEYFVVMKLSTDKIVGYGKLNIISAQTLDTYKDKEDHIQLQRLYILPEFQCYQLGSRFMLYLLYYAKNLHYHKLWLTVYDANYRAILFYERFGFYKLDDKIGFQVGNEMQYDYVMVLDLDTTTINFESILK